MRGERRERESGLYEQPGTGSHMLRTTAHYLFISITLHQTFGCVSDASNDLLHQTHRHQPTHTQLWMITLL